MTIFFHNFQEYWPIPLSPNVKISRIGGNINASDDEPNAPINDIMASSFGIAIAKRTKKNSQLIKEKLIN